MPTAAISFGRTCAWPSASATTPISVAQISCGSCSTQPACGKICRNSFCATPRIAPSRSKTMARELVVPWSRARMNDMAAHYTMLTDVPRADAPTCSGFHAAECLASNATTCSVLTAQRARSWRSRVLLVHASTCSARCTIAEHVEREATEHVEGEATQHSEGVALALCGRSFKARWRRALGAPRRFSCPRICHASSLRSSSARSS